MTDRPATPIGILWRRINGTGLERCELGRDDSGFRLSGTTLFTSHDGPVEIRYSITLDAKWRTRIAGVHVRAPSENRSVALRSDGAGNWEAEGREIPELSGAIDLDLAWTPATNTIPIRRLELPIGGAAATSVAFVPYPERTVELRQQRYERIAERRYRYTSGDFGTDLTVDENGLVVLYPARWLAVQGE